MAAVVRSEGGELTIGVMIDGGEDEYPDEEAATADVTNDVGMSSGNATTDRVELQSISQVVEDQPQLYQLVIQGCWLVY